VTSDTYSGEPELKATLKLSNMIPVPDSELTEYDISAENDASYKDLVEKEYAFIKANSAMIKKNADVLYNQKTREGILYENKAKPNYLNGTNTLDFLYAEEKCKEFSNMQKSQ
jgi:protein AbiQ